MTKIPCAGGGNYGALRDEETSVGGPLRVILDVGGQRDPIDRPAPSYRSQHHSAAEANNKKK